MTFGHKWWLFFLSVDGFGVDLKTSLSAFMSNKQVHLMIKSRNEALCINYM